MSAREWREDNGNLRAAERDRLLLLPQNRLNQARSHLLGVVVYRCLESLPDDLLPKRRNSLCRLRAFYTSAVGKVAMTELEG